MAKTEIRIEEDANKLPAPDTPFEKEETYTIDVVGESFNNDDGTSRQNIIKYIVKKGASVDLEFYLYEGKPACRVFVANKQIGNLPAWFAPKLLEHIKKGGRVNASVDHFGMSEESGLYGVTLLMQQYIPDNVKKTLSLLPCPACGNQVSRDAEACPSCGHKLKETTSNKGEAASEVIKLQQKSRLTSFILTLLFGPLGLLYSSVIGGIIMIIVAIATAPTGVGPAIAWIISILWGDSATYAHNQKIKKQAELIKEAIS